MIPKKKPFGREKDTDISKDRKSKSVRSFAALEMLLLGSGEGKTFF